MKTKKQIRNILSSLLLMFISSVSYATTYYVATNGNDANPGTQAQPFKTFAKGIPLLIPGDILYIRQGTYSGKVDIANFYIPAGAGTGMEAPGAAWPNAITIAGYPGETITLEGINIRDNVDNSVVSYIIFNNLVIRCTVGNGFWVGGNSHHIRIANSDIQSLTNNVQITHTTSYIEVIRCKSHDAPVEYVPVWGKSTGTYGFYINGSHMLIEGNQIYGNTGFGIHLYSSGGGAVSDNIIRNNIIYGNGYDDGTRGVSLGGVMLASGNNNRFYNNIVYNNNTYGNGAAVVAAYGATNTLIYNNTIFGNSGAGIEIFDSAPGTLISNNIIYNNGGQVVDWGANPAPAFSNNLGGNSGLGIALVGNPQFVNASANDFHLQAGSTAIDAGTSLSSVFTTDFEGTSRPQGSAWDIGAYEYKNSTPPPACIRSPYPGPVAASVPGTIEAENFDGCSNTAQGATGESIGYHDLSASNEGGAYRTGENVDIESCNEGGYNIGYTKAGEWLVYTVDVATTGIYTLETRVAADGNGGTFHVEINNVDKTGAISIPATGGWQTWQTLTKTGISLSQGQQVMRVVIDSEGGTGYTGNFNYFKFSSGTTTGITKTSLTDQISIYPNPTSGVCTLYAQFEKVQVIQIEIKNVLGEIVNSEKLTVNGKQFEINISHLTNGIYFLEMKAGEEKSVRKIIKQ